MGSPRVRLCRQLLAGAVPLQRSRPCRFLAHPSWVFFAASESQHQAQAYDTEEFGSLELSVAGWMSLTPVARHIKFINYLHDPVRQLSCLQRIYLYAEWKCNSSARPWDFCPEPNADRV